MRFRNRVGLAALLLLFFLPLIRTGPARSGTLSLSKGSIETTDEVTLTLIGRVVNTRDAAVNEAEVHVFIGGFQQMLTANGEETEVTYTHLDGFYIVDLTLPQALIETETIAVQVNKPGYRTTRQGFTQQEIAQSGDHYYARVPDIVPPRVFNPALFLVVFGLISLNVLHETIAAFLGTAAMLGVSYLAGSFPPDFWIIDFHWAIAFIDFDVIFLLMTMMIFMTIMSQTGIFQWLALQTFRLARGNTFLVVDIVVPEILGSNIGGAATLIGTPPNTIIGSYVGLSFNQFLVHMLPISLMSMLILLGMIRWLYRKEFDRKSKTRSTAPVAQLEAGARITNLALLRKSLLLFGATLILFFAADSFHMPPAVVAILGSTALLLWVWPNVSEMLHEVDWTTLVFFMSLFMMVGGIQEVGLIQLIAEAVQGMAGGNLLLATLLVIWVSAIASAAVANIPFTATIVPVTVFLTQTIPGAENNVLYWALCR